MNKILNLKTNPKLIFSGTQFSLRILSSNSGRSVYFQDVANLTVWRNYYPFAYRSQFFATWKRTFRWLQDVYMPSDSDIIILFEDINGVSFGHIAFVDFDNSNSCNSCQLSRVVRAPGLGPHSITEKCIRETMSWCRTELNIDEFWLRVFSDNSKAIHLYETLGFEETKRVGLVKDINREGDIIWSTSINEKFFEKSEIIMLNR